jgi:hypothetical protein
MDGHPSFSMGRASPPPPRHIRRQQQARRLAAPNRSSNRVPNRSSNQRRHFTPTPFTLTVNFCPKRWFLLPERLFSKEAYTRLITACSSLSSAHTLLKTLAQQDNPFRHRSSFRNTFSNPPKSPFVVSSEILEEMLGAIRQNQKCRMLFYQLYKQFLIRKIKQVNEVDPVSLEIPIQPLVLYDWNARSRYVFEAKTLYRDCMEKLLQRNDLFPNPMIPRNPLTNQPYTQGQLLSVYLQLKSYGKSHWTLDAFKSCQMDLELFKMVFDIPLKRVALQRVFADTNDYDFIWLLMDFIESEHEHHEAPFQKNLYRWAITNSLSAERMQRWKSICHTFYLYNILYATDPDIKLQRQQDDVHRISLSLCSDPKDLYALRLMQF